MATPENREIKVTASDALEFEPVAPSPPKKRWGLRLFVLLMVAAGSAWGWQNYGEGIMALMRGSEGGIPLVRADPGPVKVRPENPGGLRIPDRDKLVYDRLQGKTGDWEAPRGPERLLPPPEQPLPKPGTQTAAKTEALPPPAARPGKVLPEAKPVKKKPTPKAKPIAKVPTVKDVTAAKRPVPPPPPAPPPKATSSKFSLAKRTPPKEEAKPQAPGKKAAAVETAPAVKPKTPAPTALPTLASSKTAPGTPAPGRKANPRGPDFLVQLAAARSREGAEGEWNRLRAKNPDLLGDLRLTVTKADLGPERGVFYRLRAGPLADEPSARRLCSRLSTRQVGCLIIKPGQ
ncbi:MAG: SPOR domain-containing protein [Proteobacteria bacterium]|nr:SPOR domain-containing protein [Pseudomonadota bacterium]